MTSHNQLPLAHSSKRPSIGALTSSSETLQQGEREQSPNQMLLQLPNDPQTSIQSPASYNCFGPRPPQQSSTYQQSTHVEIREELLACHPAFTAEIMSLLESEIDHFGTLAPHQQIAQLRTRRQERETQEMREQRQREMDLPIPFAGPPQRAPEPFHQQLDDLPPGLRGPIHDRGYLSGADEQRPPPINHGVHTNPIGAGGGPVLPQGASLPPNCGMVGNPRVISWGSSIPQNAYQPSGGGRNITAHGGDNFGQGQHQAALGATPAQMGVHRGGNSFGQRQSRPIFGTLPTFMLSPRGGEVAGQHPSQIGNRFTPASVGVASGSLPPQNDVARAGDGDLSMKNDYPTATGVPNEGSEKVDIL